MLNKIITVAVSISAGAALLTQLPVAPAAIPGTSSGPTMTSSTRSEEKPVVDALHPTWSSVLSKDHLNIQGEYLDVTISRLAGLTEEGRVGSYPDGRVGLAGATTSCNEGNVIVPWFRQMDPRHPFIEQNVYRIDASGKLEQIGVSWAKHGFYAADAGGCGSCTGNLNPDYLDLGCTDTYGAGNNSDRYYIGPRYEVNPLTGDWDPCGSFFDVGDGSQPDCRQSTGGSGWGPIAHLLKVNDSDLTDPSATYVYEGYYVVANDDNPLNNVSWSSITPNWTGSRWSFNMGSTIRGMYIMRWGDYHHFFNSRQYGDAVVATRAVPLGNGMWHYEYCVYNHDVPQAISSFHIAVGDGAAISNQGFSAPVEEEEGYSNDPWTFSMESTGPTWQTQDYNTNAHANSLRFGTVYTFWFDADQPPTPSAAVLGMFQPGDVASENIGIVGPGRPAGTQAASLAMTISSLVRGQHALFTVMGGQPGETVYLAYSDAGTVGDTVVGMGPTHLPALNLDIELLTPAHVFATGRFDGNGVATVRVPVPANAPLEETSFQAVDVRPNGQSIKSNLEIRRVTN